MNKQLLDIQDMPTSFEDKGEQIPLKCPADLFIAMFDHTEALNKLMKKLRAQAEKEG